MKRAAEAVGAWAVGFGEESVALCRVGWGSEGKIRGFARDTWILAFWVGAWEGEEEPDSFFFKHHPFRSRCFLIKTYFTLVFI